MNFHIHERLIRDVVESEDMTKCANASNQRLSNLNWSIRKKKLNYAATFSLRIRISKKEAKPNRSIQR